MESYERRLIPAPPTSLHHLPKEHPVVGRGMALNVQHCTDLFSCQGGLKLQDTDADFHRRERTVRPSAVVSHNVTVVNVFFSCCRLRKVWQKRKCTAKNGYLTISHGTVSQQHRTDVFIVPSVTGDLPSVYSATPPPTPIRLTGRQLNSTCSPAR